MTALSTPRLTPQRMGLYLVQIPGPVAANAVLYYGALVCANASGYLVPGSTSTTLRPIGVLANGGGFGIPGPAVVGTSVDGGVVASINCGTFFFNNDGGDPISQADLMKSCYIKDDQTVSRTSGGSTRSVAGQIVGVETSGPNGAGVWVAVGQVPADAVGVAGPTGAIGPTGPRGPTGPTGP